MAVLELLIPPFPSILPIVDAALAKQEMEKLMPALAAAGATWVEYRDKRADDRLFHHRAGEALEAARQHGIALLINDRVDMALAVGAHGVHLGQEDLPVEVARRLLGPEMIVGLSVGKLEEAQVAELLPVDYIALGPVYATSTKPDAGEPVGLEMVRAVREATTIPLVAIGGITADNAAAVTAAGADCVAAASFLFGAPSPGDATRRLQAASMEGLRQRGVAAGPESE
ncbi:MAG: thiamine phosphate synthase [Acidobacteriota bacterium]